MKTQLWRISVSRFKVTFLVICLFNITSCTTSIEEDHKETLYVTTNDSTIIIYKHLAQVPLVLKKPIQIKSLKDNDIPIGVIKKSEKIMGMTRYIDGEENNAYDISFTTKGYLALITILVFSYLISKIAK